MTCDHRILLQCSEKKPEFSTIPNSGWPLGPVLEAYLAWLGLSLLLFAGFCDLTFAASFAPTKPKKRDPALQKTSSHHQPLMTSIRAWHSFLEAITLVCKVHAHRGAEPPPTDGQRRCGSALMLPRPSQVSRLIRRWSAAANEPRCE